MVYGYNGRVLRADLTTQTVQVEMPSENWYRRYLGGRNFALYYLLQDGCLHAEALSEEARIVFSTSVVTGVPVPGMCRYTVAARSPLTGFYGETEAGGYWGPELKAAGFDAIIISGRASEPVYLLVKDGAAEFRSARHLWGKEPRETEELIKSELEDDKVQIAQIGVAGENLVRFACIIHGLRHVNGRSGLGAVMGFKNLKAVVVRGHERPQVYDRGMVKAVLDKFKASYRSHKGIAALHDLGTSRNVLALNSAGLLPTLNFRKGTIEGAGSISGERMRDTYLIGRDGCYACPIRCKRRVSLSRDPDQPSPYGGPEYETIAALGSICGVTDLHAVIAANELCNQLGLDSISTGVTIAFAMECEERGLLSESSHGKPPRFGDAESLLETIRMIAFRQGLGNILAEGSRRASEVLGGFTYAMQVKGQEIPAHEPRGKWGVALGYAVSPTGADHLQAAHDPSFESEGELLNQMKPLGLLEPLPSKSLQPMKIRQFVYLQDLWSLYNVLDICNFPWPPLYSVFTLEDLVSCVRAATGWNVSLFELMKAGERGVNLARYYNVRHGLDPSLDTVPERFFAPLDDGLNRGATVPQSEFEEARKLYYEMRGWDREKGIPTAGKLHELAIGDICASDDYYRMHIVG